jgi:hypothetical protein
MNVPARIGRMNATIPLAELEVSEVGVRLSLRGPLSRISRARNADFGQIAAAQAVKAAFLSGGVRLRTTDQGTWYFWTSRTDAVLRSLAERGVSVLDGCPKLTLMYSKAWD